MPEPLYMMLCASLAWVIAQGAKCVRIIRTDPKHFDPKRALTYQGGMPSSHSAFVGAAAMSVYVIEGFSNSFAICVIFGAIIIRDATGVRKYVGEQARVLNAMLAREHSKSTDSLYLEERVGHQVADVLVGLLIGALAVGVVSLVDTP